MNKKLRTVRYLCGQQLLENLGSSKIISGYILGVLISVLASVQYLQYAGNRSIHLAEPMVLMMENPVYRFIIFIGLLLVLSNAPFITERSVLMIYRINRKEWAISSLLYMVTHIFAYYALSLLITIMITAKHSYIGNVWSRAMIRLASVEQKSAMVKFGLSIPSASLLEDISPYKALLFLYFANCFCGILLIFLAYLISLRKNFIWGNLVVLLIQFVGLSVSREYMWHVPFWIAPFSLTDLELVIVNKMPFRNIGIYFAVIIMIEVICVCRVIRTKDWFLHVGEENESM